MGEMTKMADVERPTPTESIAEGKVTCVADERAQLLSQLPDPDAGKSDEERAEIVRSHTLTSSLEGADPALFYRTACIPHAFRVLALTS